MEPGERIIGGILGGQVDPFNLAPAMPWESPVPFVPRYLAKQLWPQGFQPFKVPAPPVVAQPIQPLIPAQPSVPANQVVTQPAPAQPQPAAPRPAARDASAHEPIRPMSQRIKITERAGM